MDLESSHDLSMASCTIVTDKQPGDVELGEKVPEHSNITDGKENDRLIGRTPDYSRMPQNESTRNTPKEKALNKNMYTAARGHVQRVIDVALLISNMSRLATIVKRRAEYEPFQVYMLVTALLLSLIAQMIAGVCFFITHHRDIHDCSPKKPIDYVAFACVGAVMVLNIFISTFDATWSTVPTSSLNTPP